MVTPRWKSAATSNNVFDEPWSAAESPSSGGYQDLDVADLDGDGLLDITVADYLGRIFWVKQETSTAPALERQVINTDNIDISQLRHYDFDGDGYDELISVERGQRPHSPVPQRRGHPGRASDHHLQHRRHPHRHRDHRWRHPRRHPHRWR